jgi:dTDP-glucose 4,6-dehydratase
VKPRILVIGSNSFSGSSLVKHLLQNGYFVFGTSRRNEIQAPYNPYGFDSNSNNFIFNKLDLNQDSEKIANICFENSIETVINFSAQSMVAESWERPYEWYDTNLVSLAKLVQIFVSKKIKITKFIQFTTPEVYGNTSGKLKENFNFAPTTPYAISRSAGDLHLKAMLNEFQFPVIFTRAANVYGEHQPNYRIVPKTFITGLSLGKLHLHGGGVSKRSFIHIDDVSQAILKIIKGGEIGQTYHISTNQIVSINELVQMCCSIMNIDLDRICQNVKERPGKDFSYELDSDLIRTKLDWHDEINLKDGLFRTYDWVKNNFAMISSNSNEFEHWK